MARIGLWLVVGLWCTEMAFGQAGGWQGSPEAPPQGQAAPQAAAPNAAVPTQNPFTLTPQQQADLKRVLLAWQQTSASIKTFECEFGRWQYNGLTPNAPPVYHKGELKYAAPDKGLFRVDGDQPEQWICDGKAVYAFNYVRKEILQSVLPPQLQGKAIVNSPLPFVFGAQAADLNARYWLHIVEPAPGAQPNPNEIILQAIPRRQEDAASFSRVDIILTVKGQSLQPTAIQIFDPSGQNRTVYQFDNPKINHKDLFEPLKGDPFKVTPPDNTWRLINAPPPAAPAAVPNAQPNRR